MNTKDDSVPLIRYKKDYLTDEIARLQLALEQLQLKCPHENTKYNDLYWDGGYVDCIDCGKEAFLK